MLAALLITLREGLEAALIIGIVLGVLHRTGLVSRRREIWLGVVCAIVVSLIVGFGLHALGVAFEGTGEQIFEGIAMILAAGVLTWMIFWMQNKGKGVQQELESEVQAAVGKDSPGALFGLAFVAVVREGIETALFLTAAAFSSTPLQTLVGGGIGLLSAVLLGWLLFVAGKRLNTHLFFRITSVLLLLFAAGLLAHGIHEFQEAGVIPTIVEHIYELNPILDENSAFGAFLKTLFGYNGNPSLIESVAYIVYLGAISLLNFRANRAHS